MKYTVKIDVAGNKVTITDNETKQAFNARIGQYPRTDKDGNKVIKYQVYFNAAEVKCANNGIVAIPKDKNDKYMTTFKTDLKSKTSTKTVINPSMFN